VRAASVMAIGGWPRPALAVSAAVLLVTSYVGGGLDGPYLLSFSIWLVNLTGPLRGKPTQALVA
jgi:hypothetical protein